MKVENQVCAFEQAKKLKELGVTVSSLHAWHELKYPANEESLACNRAHCLITPTGDNIDRFIMHFIDNANAVFHWDEGTHDGGQDHSRCELDGDPFPAYTVAELSEMLPNFYPSWRFPVPGQNKDLWVATVICGPKPEGDGNIHTAPEFDRHGDTQAQALAKLLISLLETKTISFKEINQRLQNS